MKEMRISPENRHDAGVPQAYKIKIAGGIFILKILFNVMGVETPIPP